MAHRGWRGYYPENTLLSFQKAATLPIDGLEMDIHSTADGVLVVFHDDTLDRTTNGTGAIHKLTYTELQQLDAGYWWTNDDGKTYPFRGQGLTVPTMEQIFTHFPNFWINVDIKQKQPSIIKPFAQMIRDFRLTQQLCVASFDTETILEFRQECPEVLSSLSVPEVQWLFALSGLGLSHFYHPKTLPIRGAAQPPEYEGRWHIVNPRFVKAAHQHGVAVHVWTVNETSDMIRLMEMGVDGIISDFPDRLLKLLGRM